VIDFDPTSFAPNTLTSRTDFRDGEDQLTAGTEGARGDGDNRVILGDEPDIAILGDGRNMVIGDSGIIIEEDAIGQRVIVSTDFADGATDTITVGNGGSAISGGDDSDIISAAGGNNIIAGENATIRLVSGTPENILLSLTSLAPQEGGRDVISTGNGNDVIMAGIDNDRITSAAGDDLIAGDIAEFITPLGAAGTGRDGSITASNFQFAGVDTINSGADNDFVIGGRGGDNVNSSTGNDLVLGDNATLTYVNLSDVETLVLTDITTGGNDRLRAEGIGDNIIVGQFGSDNITGGQTDDILIGDLSTFQFLPTGTFNLGETHVERLVLIDFIRPDIAGNDVIFGEAGRDYLLGGFGNDTLNGGDDQDLLAGDAFRITTQFEFDEQGNLFSENLFFDSTFAFETGGFDELTGGNDPDLQIGHLGPDFFIGNTADDFLAGDTITIFAQSIFSTPNFNADRFLQIITVNFPGLGAQDLLSAEQFNSSVGAPLEERERKFALDEDIVQSLGEGIRELTNDELFELLSDRANEVLLLVQQSLQSNEMTLKIIEAVTLGLDEDTRTQVLLEEVLEAVTKSLDNNISPLERYIVQQMIQQLIAPAIEQIENEIEENQASGQAA